MVWFIHTIQKKVHHFLLIFGHLRTEFLEKNRSDLRLYKSCQVSTATSSEKLQVVTAANRPVSIDLYELQYQLASGYLKESFKICENKFIV